MDTFGYDLRAELQIEAAPVLEADFDVEPAFFDEVVDPVDALAVNLLVAAAELFLALFDAPVDFAEFLDGVRRGGSGSGTGTIRGILRLPLVAQDGYPRRIAQLRGKWEPATFSGSHGCLLCRRLWLGARWCRKHWRVPFAYFFLLVFLGPFFLY